MLRSTALHHPFYTIKSRVIGRILIFYSVPSCRRSSIAQALRATTTLLDNPDLCPLANARHFRVGREFASQNTTVLPRDIEQICT